jgi:hypothetical protein
MIEQLRNSNSSWNSISSKSNSSKQKSKSDEVSASLYRSDSVSLTMTDKDGEKVSLEIEHVRIASYKSCCSDSEREMWDRITEQMKNDFAEWKEQSIRDLLKESGLKQHEEIRNVWEELSHSEQVKHTDDLIDKMPDMWKPEAVAERIVQFTVAFAGKTESQGEDFFELAKNAIADGFGQAHSELGELPGAVNGVVERTRQLVAEKLEAWFEQWSGESSSTSVVDSSISGIDISA